jgi:hypothetical protein
MAFLFIVGIIIAIIGALTIAAVVSQGDTKSPAARSAGATPLPQTDSATQATESAAPAVEMMLQTETPAAASSAEDAAVVKDAPRPEDAPLTIESITALYAHANDDEVAVAESSLHIDVADVLATQIEQLYADYVRLEGERERLARALLTNMLFEKIERSAGRLEITTERETLDLREQFSKVSTDYDRVQFRLGSLQHLNMRLGDPRVAQQLDELVLEVKRLTIKT